MSDDDGLAILMVDDRPENLTALRAVLDPLGHRLVGVCSGPDALRELLRDDFAMILLDVQMPGMDGFETAAHIKDCGRTRNVPIIFLTAIDRMTNVAARGYALGAVDFLYKPFDSDALKAKVSVFADLHALRRRSDRVAERLEELDRVKSAFITSMSHELRTPLTSIQGYVEMLRDGDGGPLSGEQSRMLEVVARNGARLLSLSEDLLLLTRIEGGALSMATQRVDLVALAEEAAAVVAPLAAQKGLALQVQRAVGLPSVLANAGLVERVLLNLLGNAIKFTPAEGHVELSLAEQADDRVVVTVQDDGVGIPEVEQAQVFTRFFRSSTSEAMAAQGSGLGLAIVKDIVERHGGAVGVVSAPGTGTAVSFTLPVA